MPAAVPVMLIEKLQELLCARVAPMRLMVPAPCVAEIVPPQVPVRPLGVDITRPAGSVSLKPMPDSDVVVLLFWIVKLSEVLPFSGMLAAPNALVSTGGPTTVCATTDEVDVLKFVSPP